MAKLDPAHPSAGPQITGFSGTGFRIDRQAYAAAMLTPEWVRAWDAPALADLAPEHVAPLIAARPEFLLLGTGATLRRPSPTFVAALEAEGIGVEAMDSRAAARAWGVLRAEGRWIGAALIGL
ncbi:Mth938-like domain-containing protein [Sphingomonas jatrophae]|uniref:Uncharacterized conserved protein, contains Mth938-like domain n=1 Tax=Sphingomonas jatrophae TaxID=1166337 RepID=A0A1I6M905_9SPHN|nr:MTH938/NDUFAF3 family protein [Sphingomonas jatrophae]SFS12196.1 Uncharacterized conserved protein, contains Mth938-like domain [Sphingomonas jatrophae]